MTLMEKSLSQLVRLLLERIDHLESENELMSKRPTADVLANLQRVVESTRAECDSIHRANESLAKDNEYLRRGLNQPAQEAGPGAGAPEQASMSPAAEELGKIIASAGLSVTFDPERNIKRPCFNCGNVESPRRLVEVGQWSRPVGSRGDAGQAILRPLCSTCASVATKPVVTTWRYSLPNENGEGWAIAFLDSIGCFSVLSDYGDYGYRWPQNGWSNPNERDFRQFFLGTDDHYVLRKIARSDHYDGRATCEGIKRHIIELRRDRHYEKDFARDEWDRLRRYDDVDCREMFAMWYENTKIGDAAEFSVYSFSPQALAFQKLVLPRLRAAIRAQLEEEGRCP